MNKNNLPVLLAIGMVFLAAVSRMLPHPPNFTAIGAMALFSGIRLADKRLAFLVPLLALFLSDLALGFTPAVLPVYICVLFTSYLGVRLGGNDRILPVGLSMISGSVVFFLFTNLPVFYPGLYTNDFSGLMQSYAAALPFFRNQLVADLLYSITLFSIFRILNNKVLKPIS
ncbi:MAG: DUF6580 family putative transport protein [Bacteroidota bacterium]